MAAQDQFSFPYPKLGDTPRALDKGCRVCVHQMYCPAMYWFRRGGDSRGDREEPIQNKSMGIACLSWSDSLADKLDGKPTTRDLQEIDYMFVQGIGQEANRGGITDAVSGTSRRP